MVPRGQHGRGRRPAGRRPRTDARRRGARFTSSPSDGLAGPVRPQDRPAASRGERRRAAANTPAHGRGVSPRSSTASILGIAFGLSILVLEPIPYATGIFFIALFASLESLFGRTPGKAIIGIRVEDVEGEAPSLPAAMLRNAWQLVATIPVIGTWLTLVAQIGIGWLIRLEPMHRGPHDLLAHTFVVRSREPIRRRLISSGGRRERQSAAPATGQHD
ncbi:MAG: RDD family protein [Acidimicrobiales bacterium]|nr:RDD family protein [Acidimicrobiales bacterium]